MSVRAGAGVRMGVRAGVRADLGAWAGCAVAALALGAAEARGQDVLVAIGGGAGGFASNPFGEALRDLGIDAESASGSEDLLMKLRGQPWDLVIVRTAGRFDRDFEPDILVALQDHVDGGGALHFQIADLENMPDPWYDLLGLEGAVDLELPLSDIRAPLPVHPSVPGIGLLGLADERFPPDFGDVLIPAEGAFVTQWYEDGRRPSTIISRDGRVLVNGQQWDNWAGGDGFVAVQIQWLLSCKADLDGDGEVTVFDFITFQSHFDAGDPRADVFYDRRLDVFDFLAFLNIFEIGCP